MHNLARTKPKAQTDWLSHPSIHPFINQSINQSTNPLARLGGNVSALCREERLFAKELLTDFDWFVGPSIDWAEEGFPSASRPVTAHANANAATAATTITAAATKLCAAADPQPSWAPLGWRPTSPPEEAKSTTSIVANRPSSPSLTSSPSRRSRRP